MSQRACGDTLLTCFMTLPSQPCCKRYIAISSWSESTASNSIWLNGFIELYGRILSARRSTSGRLPDWKNQLVMSVRQYRSLSTTVSLSQYNGTTPSVQRDHSLGVSTTVPFSWCQYNGITPSVSVQQYYSLGVSTTIPLPRCQYSSTTPSVSVWELSFPCINGQSVDLVIGWTPICVPV